MNDWPNGSRRQREWPAPEQRRTPTVTDTSAKAQTGYERYLALARNAHARGDAVEMENCYQHAEHFLRMIKQRMEQKLQPVL